MKINEISKVVIYPLQKKSDRRGAICELFMGSEHSNCEHFMDVAYRTIQRITSLLCISYFYNDKADAGVTEFTEQNESWINIPFTTADGQEIATGTVVRLQHKYWSQERVDGFIDILLSVANVNGWEVVDKRWEEEMRKNTMELLVEDSDRLSDLRLDDLNFAGEK